MSNRRDIEIEESLHNFSLISSAFSGGTLAFKTDLFMVLQFRTDCSSSMEDSAIKSQVDPLKALYFI